MIVLNERRWAEQVLDTGELGDNPAATAAVLARYYYHVQGLKRKEIIRKLDSLYSQLIPDYNPYGWEQLFDKVATQARRRELIEIESIPVNAGEMKIIEALPSSRLQRLAFTMVVIARYFNTIKSTNNNWVNLELKDVFALACITIPVLEQADMYKVLIDANVISYSRKVGNNNARVLILDDTKPKLFVDDLRAIGHQYQLYKGEPYSRCQKCGVLFRQSKQNNRKYCTECSKNHAMKMRKFTCIDCGKEVFVVSRDGWSCRCAECQTAARKLKYQRYHEKLKKESATALPKS